MNHILFITFFLQTLQMCFASLEQPLPPHSDEMFELMVKINEVHPITYYVGADNTVNNGTVVSYVQQVYYTLNDLSIVFKTFVANRFYIKLKWYCQAALELIQQSLDVKSFTSSNIIDSIKFDKNCDFCVVSFLYDLKYDVNELLHIIFILKIIGFGRFTLSSLGDELEHILKTYLHDKSNHSDSDVEWDEQNILEEEEEDTSEIDTSELIDEKQFDESHNFTKKMNQKHFKEDFEERAMPDLISYLSVLRDEIQMDSELFCLPTTVPLMDMNLYDNKFNKPKADFIEIIFNSNKFYVYLDSINKKSKKRQLEIQGWKLYYELENGEKDESNSLTHWVKNKRNRIIDCFLIFGCTKNTIIEYNLEEYDGIVTTLSSLRMTLQTYYYYDYPNVLEYQNIAADLMILNGIRELVKILVEIKDEFCVKSSYRKITADKIHVMRLRLFMIKLLFDEFIRSLFEKLRYDATNYPHVIQIREKVNKTLGFLEIGKKFNVNYIKSSIDNELEKVTVQDKTKKLEYKNFLVLDPIENMYLLFNLTFSYFE